MMKNLKIELTAEQLKAKRVAAAAKGRATKAANKAAAELVAKQVAFDALVALKEEAPVAPVAPAPKAKKTSTGWLKAAIAYITSQCTIGKTTAISAVKHAKKVWITVDGQNIFWLRHEDRADLLLQKLLAL